VRQEIGTNFCLNAAQELKGGLAWDGGAMARRARDGGAQAGRPGWLAAALAIAGLMVAGAPAAGASREDRVFTIGNYPVEARAADAVAAKERAIADGQQAAFRSLLKRLVPVTSYRRLASLKATPSGRLIESFAVRSERNSSTEYIASYDFVFAADPVRRLLDQQGIPYLDRQAPPITVVLAYRVAPEVAANLPQTFAPAAGADAWLYAWKALDLANSLTPASVKPLKREVHGDTVKGLADGNLTLLRTLESEYQTQTVLLAVLEPEAGQKKVRVVLVGRDAVDTMVLRRAYRLEGLDLAYSAEAAAVISLAILEGRWKAINVRGGRDGPSTSSLAPPYASAGGPGSGPIPPPAAGGGGPVTVAVEFQGMGEWQEISRQLAQTPEITGLEVLGLSARRARVSLAYPGGPERLALVLAARGLILHNARGGWVLTRR
jgi:hypothetical protein